MPGQIKLQDDVNAEALAKAKRAYDASLPAPPLDDLRLKCLDLALMGSQANLAAESVITRAQAFVDYVQNGPGGPRPPSLDDRLTQAFLAAGESLSADD